MVPDTCMRVPGHQLQTTAITLLLASFTACDSAGSVNPANRDVPWTYGPVNTATAEHVQGTGKAGGTAIAQGWQCRLQDGKRLLVQPFRLAPSHALFGKVVMSLSLFDKTGKEIATMASAPITAANATFTFELTDAVATQLWDLVLWYRKA